MNNKKTVYIIPVGGLGNRMRFVNSACSVLFSENPKQNIRVINFVTNMFPDDIGKFLFFDSRVKVVNIRFRSEKLLLIFLRFLMYFSHFLTFGYFAKYGAKKIDKKNKIISSFNRIDKGCISFFPLRCAMVKQKNYNAVHIRRGDNKRAIAKNDLDKYFNFIELSEYPVYLASDDEKLKRTIVKKFPKKVQVREVDLDRGDKYSLQEAFLEMTECINADLFLGSDGSSFSAIINAYRSL